MKFSIDTKNKYLHKAVQELAFENGYGWHDGKVLRDGHGIINFNIDKQGGMTYGTHGDVIYSALTDWQKIEEAMKPKEPRVIWVNEKDWGDGAVLSEKCYTDKAKAERHSEVLDSSYLRTIKFQEVI